MHRFILKFLVLAALISLNGCLFYQRYPLAKSRLPKIDKNGLTFYLLDASKPLVKAWYVSDAEFGNDTMRCFLVQVDEMRAMDILAIKNNRDARLSKDEVLLFAQPALTQALADTATVTISYGQLEKIMVHEVNQGKSVALSFFLLLGPPFLGALGEQ